MDLTGWVQNEWDGTVTMEIQGRETLINKLLVGLNHDRFITIEWMDTTEIPLRDDERSFFRAVTSVTVRNVTFCHKNINNMKRRR